MKFISKLALTTFALFSLASCNNTAADAIAKSAENTASTEAISTLAEANSDDIQVIQFHSEHRCMTCNKIETLTRETVSGLVNLPFSLVNVDDAANEKQADAFEAAGTALYLYNPKTGAKKDLTDFAFMNARNDENFKKGLAEAIEEFSNQ